MPVIGHEALILAAGLLAVADLGASPARAEMPDAVPVEGDPFRAQIVAVDPQWQITLQTAAGPRALPAASLVRWGQCAEWTRGSAVILVDGSLLVADVIAADRESLVADSPLFGELKLPRASIAGVVFRPLGGRARNDRLLDRVASGAGESGRIVLTNGDELAGALETVKDGRLHLQTSVRPLEVEARRVAALLSRPTRKRADTGEAAKTLWASAGLSDGTRLHAAALEIRGDALRVTLQSGPVWNTASKELVFLQPLGGKVVYLSDLKADGYRHVPYLTLPWPYRTDRSVSGAMLRSGGRLYLKGLGMHSASRLTYALARPYRRFCAELAIDDETEGGGSAGFRLFVDGQLKYTGPTVRGGQPAIPVSIDIVGAKRLDLVVDFAERADELDHADWLDARLVR